MQPMMVKPMATSQNLRIWMACTLSLTVSSRFGCIPLTFAEATVTQGEETECREKPRLMAEYENSTARFLEAVQELHRKMGTSPKEVYERLDRAANEARLRSEYARLSLEEHIATDRC